MATTSTSTIELDHFDLPAQPFPTKRPQYENTRPRTPDELEAASHVLGELGGSEPDPTAAVEASLKWNEDQSTTIKTAATFFCFLVMGCNDSAYGPLIPYIEKYYDLSHTIVSLIFLSPFVGYVSSALLNNYLHLKYGQRGISIIGSACHMAAYVVIACHPPYIVLVFAFILAGFGNGLADAAWNAWVGSLANSSQLLGFLHAFYGVGGVISPLIATSMIAKGNLPWFSFYYIMIGLAAFEMGSLSWAFWKSTGAEYRKAVKDEGTERESGLTDALFQMPAARVSWVCALFLLCYVGVEVALGGWIVLFMLNVRHGEAFASGMSAVGFWLGITVGRATLGFVTPKIGIRLATSIYIAAAMALELVFWLVPQFYVSAVAVSFQGFFLGPLFPSAVLVASKLLPRHQHVVVIGFAAAFGGCGAAILPFVTGILAQASGVQVLQPIILALLGAMLVIWLCLPRINKRND